RGQFEDRALGRVPGDPGRAMTREIQRLAGAMKARTWLLGTAGALMPFVGLFGTVIGVMASFRAIGESGQGGFAIVSVGISQALIATAVGIAVALEGVVLFNVLQNVAVRLGRELTMLVDELGELVDFERRSRAGSPQQ
ncbi:MAG: MotA/TolQ/ExbB proton channel family protein, partial [Deltaproteobacteria bacterium]